MINPPRLDSPLDVPGKLPAQDKILYSDRRRRAKEQHTEPHNVGKKIDDRSQHGPDVRIMKDSADDRRRIIGQPHVVNYCGPQMFKWDEIGRIVPVGYASGKKTLARWAGLQVWIVTPGPEIGR